MLCIISCPHDSSDQSWIIIIGMNVPWQKSIIRLRRIYESNNESLYRISEASWDAFTGMNFVIKSVHPSEPDFP